MSTRLGYFALLAFFAAAVAVIACRPEWYSDQNGFLKNFVNHEILNLLGVILAITLASVANIHFEFNKLEEHHKQRFLSKSRRNLAKNAYWLIGLFALAVLVVCVKPIVIASNGAVGEAIVNLLAVGILLWHVLILVSLTQLAFAIEPDIPGSVASPPPQSPPSSEGGKRRKPPRG